MEDKRDLYLKNLMQRLKENELFKPINKDSGY